MIEPDKEFIFSWEGDHALWTVLPTLKYLDGHFPNFPIVPGVALLDAALEAVRKLANDNELVYSKITSAKFLKPVTPGQTLKLSVSQKDEWNWHCRWTESETLVSTLSFCANRPSQIGN